MKNAWVLLCVWSRCGPSISRGDGSSEILPLAEREVPANQPAAR
jgi:hypothetical protein